MNNILIETNRLFLREFTEADTPSLHAILSHPEVMRFSDGVETKEATRQKLAGYRQSYRQRGFGKWAIEEKDERRFIGYCGFGVAEFDGEMQPELGFRLLPHYWGRGMATEAAQACSLYAFSHLGFSRFLGFAHPMNRASHRVLDKIGMTLVGNRYFHGYPVILYEKRCGI
jgi:RimJ/RimL family protein N-acetyltransferase